MPFTTSLGNTPNKTDVTDVNYFSPLFDTIIDQLRDSASVMGPDHANKIKDRIKQDSGLIARLESLTRPPRRTSPATRANLQDDRIDITTLTSEIIDELIAPVLKDIEDDAKRVNQEIYENVIKLEEQTSAIDSGTKTKIALQRVEAKVKFEESIKTVCSILERMKINKTRVARINEEINAMYYDTEGNDSDLAELSTETMQKIKNQQDVRAQLKDEIYELQNALFTHFDDTMGGAKAVSKHDKRQLELPANMEKGKTQTRDIVDAIKAYMAHRSTEYYAIIPYVEYTMSSYDPKDGMFVEPPRKETKYKEVPDCLREEYTKQSSTLYREILKKQKHKEMAKITAIFKCGLNNDKSAKCMVDDGVMAIYCLLSKYGKSDAHSITDLVNMFTASPGHFKQGSPANKIAKLREHLEEILEMGIPLKSSDVMDPVIDILSERHPKFAVILADYEGGGQTPEDCAALLDQMYSDIEQACKGIERACGAGIWQTQNTAYMTNISRFGHGKGGSKGRTKGKGKGNNRSKGSGKGKSRYKRNFNTMNSNDSQGKPQTYGRAFYSSSKGKGKGKRGSSKGKGKGKSANKSCLAQGCSQSSGKFRFCIECFKKGMDTGHIICQDGYKQVMARANQANSITFSDQQLHAMSAIGQQAMNNQNLSSQNINHGGTFRMDARETINASMADPQARKRSVSFMDNLGISQ